MTGVLTTRAEVIIGVHFSGSQPEQKSSLESSDNFRSGCRNVSQCHLRQSGLLLQGRSHFTCLLYDNWDQTMSLEMSSLTLARCILALYVAVSWIQIPSFTTGRVRRLKMVSWFSFLWNQRTFPLSISKWYWPSLCLEWLPTVSNMDWMPLLVSSLIHVDMVIPSLGILSKWAPSSKTSPPTNKVKSLKCPCVN